MKKLLAILISVSVILSCCIIGGIVTSAEVSMWDGTTYTEPTDSDSDGIKEINSAAEFAWVGVNGGDGKYILTVDVYLNDMELSFDGNTPVLKKANGDLITDLTTLNVWEGKYDFRGTLDGDGHTVSGMFNNTVLAPSADSKRGMFGKGINATVKNMRVINTYFAGATYESVFFAYNNAGASTVTVDTCYVENAYLAPNLEEKANSNYPTAGFVAGYIQGAKLVANDCLVANAKISGSFSRIGGVLGDAWASGGITMNRTLNASGLTTFGGNVGNASAYAGAMVGEGNYAFVASKGANCPAVAVVAEGAAKGNAAAVSVWSLGDKFYTTDSYPVQGIFLDEITSANKQLGNAPYEGAGTEADPYVIKTAEQFIMAVETFGSSKYYKLANDIYLNDVDKIDWATGEVAEGYTPTTWYEYYGVGGDQYVTPNGTGIFNGHIDGAGYAIHGVYYPFGTKTTAAGLIPAATNSSIKNLALKDSYIAGGRWTGGLIGYSLNNVTVDTCLLDETVTVNGYDAGGEHYTSAFWKAAENRVITPFMGNPDKDVNFESEACGGIVGYASKNFTAKNCAVYANVIDDSTGLTYTNDEINNGEAVAYAKNGHRNAIVGTSWNATVTMSGNVSVLRPHDPLSGTAGAFSTTCENNYAQGAFDGQTCCNVVTAEQMTGANALANMSGLDTSVWTKTNGYPLQKIFTCYNTNYDHDWSDWAETTKPDCDVDGEETKTCGVCGDTETQPITAPGHDDATEWTSDANGHWHACANCTDKLDYAAHTYDKQVTTADYEAAKQDCESPATYYYSCECGAKGTQTFTTGTAAGHNPGAEWESDANNHWHVCGDCGEETDTAGHTYDKQVATDAYKATSADCDDAATYYYSCVCGAKGTQTFASGSPAGHAPATTWTNDADGHWHACANCDDQLDYAAHNGGEATCSAKAVCDACQKEYGTVDANNHDLTEVDANEANHDEDGNIAHYKCDDCDKLFDDENASNELAPEDVIVDGGDHDFTGEYEKDEEGHWKECECGGKDTKAAHNFGEWEVTSEPSEVTPGEKARECSDCGFVETALVPATGADAPETGDTANTLPWMLVAMTSILALAGATLFLLRKSKA